ncbi:hypothetical protein GCM10010273_07450 [Streptomyces lavendulocolor]
MEPRPGLACGQRATAGEAGRAGLTRAAVHGTPRLVRGVRRPPVPSPSARTPPPRRRDTGGNG